MPQNVTMETQYGQTSNAMVQQFRKMTGLNWLPGISLTLRNLDKIRGGFYSTDRKQLKEEKEKSNQYNLCESLVK